jgi:hypothetical protein
MNEMNEKNEKIFHGKFLFYKESKRPMTKRPNLTKTNKKINICE